MNLCQLSLSIIQNDKITGADFGHSPWAETNISDNNGQVGFLIVGEANGNVTGWEWNNKRLPMSSLRLQKR